MDYNVQVCDWTQVRKEGGYKYGVSVNDDVVYESNDLDLCFKIKQMLIKSYNTGVRNSQTVAQKHIGILQQKESLFIGYNEVFTVTPEMQRKAKGN